MAPTFSQALATRKQCARYVFKQTQSKEVNVFGTSRYHKTVSKNFSRILTPGL